MKETQDLVQETFIRTLVHMEDFDNRREGAFLYYLRRVFLNLVRDELRRAARHPAQEPVDGNLPDGGVSPLDLAIGRELVERYETALLDLPEHQREAVILRVEMGFTYQEVASALGIAEANTARMMIIRAIQKLAARFDE